MGALKNVDAWVAVAMMMQAPGPLTLSGASVCSRWSTAKSSWGQRSLGHGPLVFVLHLTICTGKKACARRQRETVVV